MYYTSASMCGSRKCVRTPPPRSAHVLGMIWITQREHEKKKKLTYRIHLACIPLKLVPTDINIGLNDPLWRQNAANCLLVSILYNSFIMLRQTFKKMIAQQVKLRTSIRNYTQIQSQHVYQALTKPDKKAMILCHKNHKKKSTCASILMHNAIKQHSKVHINCYNLTLACPYCANDVSV